MDYSRLESKNIVLRKAKLSDYKSMLENVWSDEEVYNLMLFTPTKTEEEAIERCNKSILYQKTNYAYFITLKDTDEAIGFCAIKEYEPNRYKECGIGIGTKYQGKGFGKEVLELLLDLAFNKLHCEFFQYGYFEDNVKSKALANHYGFKFYSKEEIVRPWDNEKRIVDLCLLSKDEFNKLNI